MRERISYISIFHRYGSQISPAMIKQNRNWLLDEIESIWIKNYLDHFLNEMNSLNLEMKFVEPQKVLQRIGMKDSDLADSNAIFTSFTELGRRLVILGEPGAGKTVTLLQLCRELIAEARTNEHKPIPMVLALSSWAADQLPFEEWLCKEACEKYGLSKRMADTLVQQEQLLYLLDGLDEVAVAQRDACLQAIKQFVEARPVDYVICCRRKEFEGLLTRLELLGQLILQPLSDLQIGEYLSRDDFAGLPSLWNDSEPLREFGRVPFMLNTIAVVARDKSELQLRFELKTLHDSVSLRNEILEAYVNERLHTKLDPKYNDFSETRQRLKWLAWQLIHHDETDFYIENIRFDWLNFANRNRYYSQIAKLSSRLSKIKIADRLKWSPNWLGLTYWLVIWTLAGLWLEKSEGVEAGTAIGLGLGLVFGITTGFKSEERIEIRIQPNLGIRRSLTNFRKVIWMVGTMIGLLFGSTFGFTAAIATNWAIGLAIGLVSGTLFGLMFGIPFGLLVGLEYGGTSVIQHAILRLFLAREGHIPYWRYDKFLDYCADLIILRKVGGGYRFVHDYMRQYLASAAFVPDADHTSPTE